jgi:hypothetical protein
MFLFARIKNYRNRSVCPQVFMFGTEGVHRPPVPRSYFDGLSVS